MSTPIEEEAKSTKKKSRYFGYACGQSFDMKKALEQGDLTIDWLLGLDPAHDHLGQLALKLFLKHLEKDGNLERFDDLIAKGGDRIAELKPYADEKLLKRIEMVEFYS